MKEVLERIPMPTNENPPPPSDGKYRAVRVKGSSGDKSAELTDNREELKSVLTSHGGNHHYYDYQTGITVVARHENGKTYIGVAKCGNDDQKDEELGYEIAKHRTFVKPYSIIKGDLRRIEFHRICQVLDYHISNNSQWSQKALDRIDV